MTLWESIRPALGSGPRPSCRRMPSTLDTAGTTLVVGHSHDPSSDDALAVALDLGRRLRAQLHVLHVIGTGDYPIDIDAGDWEERGRQALAEQRCRVERVLVGTGLRWTYETRRGDPVVELVRAAEEHDALFDGGRYSRRRDADGSAAADRAVGFARTGRARRCSAPLRPDGSRLPAVSADTAGRCAVSESYGFRDRAPSRYGMFRCRWREGEWRVRDQRLAGWLAFQAAYFSGRHAPQGR
jgi:nucleotide-binding universal stress UspA family protein